MAAAGAAPLAVVAATGPAPFALRTFKAEAAMESVSANVSLDMIL